MRKTVFLLPAVFLLFIVSCNHTSKRNPRQKAASGHSTVVRYAKGFEIEHQGKKIVIKVYNPWNKGTVMAEYRLTRENPGKGEIKIPVTDAAVFSSTQINAFEKLGMINVISGVSDSRYIANKTVKQKIREGKIAELAAGGSYFTEKILQRSPQVIFYSPYEKSAPVPSVLRSLLFIPYPDYMESDPLGRAEWIKFTAAFLDKEDKADSIFNGIETEYLKLKKMTGTVDTKPTVFSGRFGNGQWFMPGGKSYIARLFRDAGARYVFDYMEKEGSVPLDFETVWNKARNADFWRITGVFPAPPGYETFGRENRFYSQFNAFKKHHILFCDTRSTAYFETSPLAPHLILADFIKAFHPELLPAYRPVYYKLMK